MKNKKIYVFLIIILILLILFFININKVKNAETQETSTISYKEVEENKYEIYDSNNELITTVNDKGALEIYKDDPSYDPKVAIPDIEATTESN